MKSRLSLVQLIEISQSVDFRHGQCRLDMSLYDEWNRHETLTAAARDPRHPTQRGEFRVPSQVLDK